jgi:multidrug efflux pump subunit AcrA (membrane-fusion protein)
VNSGGKFRLFDRDTPLGQARNAEVAIVDPLIDGPSGTFGARLLLPNPDHDLPAGLRCQVRFLDDE